MKEDAQSLTPMPPLEGVSVLMVEDNPIIAYVESALFTRLQCQVTLAPNGQEALAQLREQRYDLVILDIGLPDISGFEVVKQFREWQKEHDHYTFIVAVSAHLDSEQKAGCLQLGMDGVIIKPLRGEAVAGIVRAILKKRMST
jgi:CheY-like chemotaxis protein